MSSRSGRRINIVFSHNGQGLTRDALLLAGLLRRAGQVVTLSPVPTRLPRGWRFLPERLGGAVRDLGINLSVAIRSHLPGGRWDLNLFLESIDTRYLPLARVNGFIPNHEWLTPQDRALMGSLDLVLFKTRHAETRLSGCSECSVFTGFTSEDRRLPGAAKDWNAAVHVAGWNPYKGTATLVAEWPRHAEWPDILVVAQTSHDGAASNLRVVHQRVPDTELQALQNARGIHLCPSEVEGFGHSINEARSCGALVVTADAPPMNELVTPESGLLIAVERETPMASGTRYGISAAGLEETMNRLSRLSHDRRARLGTAARAAYEVGAADFSRRLLAAIADA